MTPTSGGAAPAFGKSAFAHHCITSSSLPFDVATLDQAHKTRKTWQTRFIKNDK
jgi:hypothetical protein